MEWEGKMERRSYVSRFARSEKTPFKSRLWIALSTAHKAAVTLCPLFTQAGGFPPAFFPSFPFSIPFLFPPFPSLSFIRVTRSPPRCVAIQI